MAAELARTSWEYVKGRGDSKHSNESKDDGTKVQTLQKQQMQAGTDMADLFNEILAHTLSTEEEMATPMTRAQEIVQSIISMRTFQTLTSIIIISHVFLSIYETDQRAAHVKRESWQFYVETCFLLFYVLELLLRIFVERIMLFKQPANWFDVLIVAVDIFSLLLDQIFGGSELGPVSVLRGPFRAARSLRILRIIRKIAVLRDLYMMMNGMLISLRTITFATLFIFMTLTLFSILAVETLNSVNKDLWASRDDVECERCYRAFSTVMSSNLTFMQTILCGDSWGVLAIPLLEKAPWSSAIIIPAFVVVELGLLNVVVAVVVEGQVNARERDKEFQTLLKADQRRRSFGELCRLFRTMDSDGSGEVDVHELIHSYENNLEFRAMMNMLDIEPYDLPLLFSMMDKDLSGSISYDEFVQELHALKNLDLRTLVFLTRQHVIEAKDMIQQAGRANDKRSVTPPDPVKTSGAETTIYGDIARRCSRRSPGSPQGSDGQESPRSPLTPCGIASGNAVGVDCDVRGHNDVNEAKAWPSCGAASVLQSSGEFSAAEISMEVRFDQLLQQCLDLTTSALGTLRQCEGLAGNNFTAVETGKSAAHSTAPTLHKLQPLPVSTLVNRIGASPTSLALVPSALVRLTPESQFACHPPTPIPIPEPMVEA